MVWGMISKLVSKVTLGVLLALLSGVVCGGGSDDDYLTVFEQLQAADQTAEQGELEAARTAYLEVQARLAAFRQTYPAWHPEIIDFRLRYVRQRLMALAPATDADLGPEQAPVTEAPDPEVLRTQLLEARLRQLEFEREELQARLREALAPSPASGTSPELRRAEDRIRSQQKEIDLLRYALLAQGEATHPLPDPGSPRPREDDSQARLAALQAELELERAKNSALQLAAVELQARLREAQATGAGTTRFDTYVDVNPGPVESGSDVSDLELGRGLIDAGRIDEALVVLGRAAQAAPESTEALTLLGRVFLAKGLPDAAEALLHRALRIDPNHGGAHLEMARLCLSRFPRDPGTGQHHYQAARRAGIEPDPELELLLAASSPTPVSPLR